MKRIRAVVPPFVIWVLGFWLFVLLQPQNPPLTQTIKRNSTIDPVLGFAVSDPKTFTVPQSKYYDERLRLIAERPLFSENRRQPDPLALTPKKVTVEPESHEEQDVVKMRPSPFPRLIFKGFVRHGKDMQALIVEDGHYEEQWVSEGDEV
ncbi:hypothetical protein, partial [Epibacterium ulvae]|uniref:hypothetical protein n=1 Tax=Epibacterium ulvae TaxID=1156985 RepID=UPI002490EF3C